MSDVVRYQSCTWHYATCKFSVLDVGIMFNRFKGEGEEETVLVS